MGVAGNNRRWTKTELRTGAAWRKAGERWPEVSARLGRSPGATQVAVCAYLRQTNKAAPVPRAVLIAEHRAAVAARDRAAAAAIEAAKVAAAVAARAEAARLEAEAEAAAQAAAQDDLSLSGIDRDDARFLYSRGVPKMEIQRRLNIGPVRLGRYLEGRAHA